MDPNLLRYYREHGPMTEVRTKQDMVSNIPPDLETIVSYVQNVLLHQHWSGAYGVELNPARQREPFLRSFEEKLVFLSEKGYSHVSEQKPYPERMVGICRDFSVVGAALCREAGIPARARCGFATYFGPGNPLDVGKDQFITAPRAWQMCRQGKADPELFGIFQWWGYDYLNCNLMLDVNSLLKMPMQPWDGWKGYKATAVQQWTEADFEVVDTLAELALSADENFPAFSQFVLGHDQIKVPANLTAVFNVND